MTEPATEPTPAPDAPEASREQEQPDVSQLPDWAREALNKANREAANYRTKVRELEPRAQLADRLEEASKTEAQRLTERAEAAQRDLEQARAEAVRYRLAAQHGINAEEDLDLLGTGTEEQLTARAERIAAKNAAALAAQLQPPAPRRSGEALRPGATPSDGRPSEDEEYEQFVPHLNIPTKRK